MSIYCTCRDSILGSYSPKASNCTDYATPFSRLYTKQQHITALSNKLFIINGKRYISKCNKWAYPFTYTVSDTVLFLLCEVVKSSSNTPAAIPPLVDCPLLLIQYIRSCPLYMDTVTIRHLRTSHAKVRV